MTPYDPARYTPLHRIITIDAAPGGVTAQITDNVHQFSVVVLHHAGWVTGIESAALRVPWTTCPLALGRLQELVGTPVQGGSPPHIDKSRHCTHLFDLARLAIAGAGRPGLRRYDVHVALGDGSRAVEARVLADGQELLSWTVVGGRVASQGPFQGCSTSVTTGWPRVETELREAALLCRRALLVFLGSGRSWGTLRATELPYMDGACHTFQAETAPLAVRPMGFRHFPAEAVPTLADG